jgi:endonuclease YncB( thermonuclease family)
LVLVLALAWAGSAQAAKAPPQTTLPTSSSGAAGPLDSAESRLWGTVRAVRDGTNLVVATPELAQYDVRLLGVELPEPPRPEGSSTPASPGQPFGQQAAAYVRDLLVDKQVRLDVYGKDRSGRALAVVWLGDIDVNLTLVKEGLAWVSPSLSIPRVRIGLEVAERQAQVGKYGLWALPDPEPPWEFRKRHRLPGD